MHFKIESLLPPLCFVHMPFGKKLSNNSDLLINFDAIYSNLIAPTVTESGLEPIRADEEIAGPIIHTLKYKRLILCEFAVVDLTTANANIFYELGVRHAVRPWSTVLLYAKGFGRLPFDVTSFRPITYDLDEEGLPRHSEFIKSRLVERLHYVKENMLVDSPMFQLLEGYPDINHINTDVFREQLRYHVQSSAIIKKQIADARKQGKEALISLEKGLNFYSITAFDVIIEIFLSYRAVNAWEEMINLVQKMPSFLTDTVMIQEQLALALNRNGKGEEAERVLLDLLERRGPSSETYGILGRVYKDRWETAYRNGDEILDTSLLDQAIEAYLNGFHADWRDAYPGINAVVLMEIKEPPDSRQLQIIPIVKYSVERRIDKGKPNYWDYATLLELAIIDKDRESSFNILAKTVSLLQEKWEGETTLRNLCTIRKAREKRRELIGWTKEVEDLFHKKINDF